MTSIHNSKFSRRFVLRAGSGAIAVSAFAGTTFGGRSIALAQDDPVSLMNWDVVADTPLEDAINAYQEQSGVEVKVRPAPTQDYTTRMRTLLGSGSPPDIMRIDDDLVRGFAEANQLLDLTEFIERDGIDTTKYTEGLYSFTTQQDGTHPAWVIGTQPRVIYYNQSAFEDAGVTLPPTTWTGENWTWDTFLEAAKALKTDDRWGALIYHDTAYEQTFSVNNGVEGGIYSPDGTSFTLADPAGIEAVQWATDLSCVHEVQPPWGELQRDGAANQFFVSGRVGMMLATFGQVPYFQKNVSDFTWDIAPVPAKVAQRQEGSLIVFCIPKDAKNPEGAWQLLKFLGEASAAQIFAEEGYFIPAWTEAGSLIQPGDQPPASISLFNDAAANQASVTPTTNQLRAEQVYRPQLDLVYTCEKTAEEVLTAVRQEVEAALAGDLG
jgi:multiple sugar transport system substrate-binding protein